jgi:Ca2+-binding RTX toxin-like protein
MKIECFTKRASFIIFSVVVIMVLCSVVTTSIASAASLHGSKDSDTLDGTPEADKINGGGGDDLIYAYGGNDRVMAGDGNDEVYPGAGDDYVVGGKGNDKVYHTMSENAGSVDYYRGDRGDHDTLIITMPGGLPNMEWIVQRVEDFFYEKLYQLGSNRVIDFNELNEQLLSEFGIELEGLDLRVRGFEIIEINMETP